MKENDDIWLKQWKDCLEDYEEEVPVNGWERLQADLHANDDSSTVNGRVIPFRRWRVVAAAAVVVLIAGAGIWFLASDQAPQVPSIDSPIAQAVQLDTPEPQSTIATPDTEKEETTMPVTETVTPVKQETAQPKPAVAEPTLQKVAPQTVVAEEAPVVRTEASSSVSSPASTQTPSDIAPTQPAGTPIQVINIDRNQAQRSVNPVYQGGQAGATNEVGVVDRRQVRMSTDERMLNAIRLRGQSDATTRSHGEITDIDRVFNSFTAHYDELYNKAEHLFDNGTGKYSTLDNALFLAGLVKKMQSQRSEADEQLYREIASRLVELQQPNGSWKDSLLDPASHSVDTDTESYICYALAWGLNNGLLSRKQYRDAVNHAWKAIGNCNSEPCLMAAEQVQKLQ